MIFKILTLIAEAIYFLVGAWFALAVLYKVLRLIVAAARALLCAFRDSAQDHRDLVQRHRELENTQQELRREQLEWEQKVETDKQVLYALAQEKSLGFPWLAQAYADYFALRDMQVAEHLLRKEHPARRAAEEIRAMSARRKDAEKLWRLLKYQLQYYETLFPWLSEFRDEDVDELIVQILTKRTPETPELDEREEDPARRWLTPGEYASLSTAEKYQRALDRYWKSRKSSWQVGRDYERYVGYLYEKEGWRVRYQGIVEGLADLGRDLITFRKGETHIVQCKCWSFEKRGPIHEKHIFQLYGTVAAYKIDTGEVAVLPVFYTSTILSDRAKQFARVLGVDFKESQPLESYPCIKCNVSRKDNAKIYHLPFDQQYDTTRIEEERTECYAETVQEAESYGFRRAFRWRGSEP